MRQRPTSPQQQELMNRIIGLIQKLPGYFTDDHAVELEQNMEVHPSANGKSVDVVFLNNSHKNIDLSQLAQAIALKGIPVAANYVGNDGPPEKFFGKEMAGEPVNAFESLSPRITLQGNINAIVRQLPPPDYEKWVRK